MFKRNFQKDNTRRSVNIKDFLVQIFFSIIVFAAMILINLDEKNLFVTIFKSPYTIVLNLLPVILTGLLLQAVLGRLRLAIILNSSLYIIIYLINRTKIIYRNAPIKISDFALGFEAMTMSKNSYYPDKLAAIISIAFIILIILLTKPIKSNKIKNSQRIIISVLAIIISGSLYNFVYAKDSIYNSLPRAGNTYNLLNHFDSKGFNYCFLYNIKKSFVKAPNGFDEKEIKSKEQVDRSEDIAVVSYNKKPNIIWIMGEAFTDLSENDVFSFTAENNPLKNYKKLREDSVMHGRIVTPSFGGGTGDTEFDVLTGTLTVDCAPDQSFGFNAIRRKTESLPSALKKVGYQASAFHPGFAWFYGRQDAYPKLGFDRSYFLEDIENPVMKGGYLSEKQFSEIYRNRFLENIKNSKEPIFDYAVDIQNHGAYFYDKYGENLPYQCSKTLSEDAANNFGSYFLGIRDMDIMLGEVYEMINSIDEPTIMVFYGDHLPYLGNEPSAFDEIGMNLNHENLEKEIEFYSTPFIICANKSGREFLNTENVEIEKGGVISANYLTSLVLDMLNYNKIDNFFMYNSNLRRELPIISRNYIYDGKDYYPRENPPENIKKLYDDYKKYEYYRINY